jgi:two-component system, LytTR family, sensor histidine kinase AlgZ
MAENPRSRVGIWMSGQNLVANGRIASPQACPMPGPVGYSNSRMASTSTAPPQLHKVAHRLVGGRPYYVSHLAGWTGYGLLQYWISPRGLPVALSAVAWCGTGLLGTHLLAWYADRRRWQTIPQLAIPLVVGTLLLAAAMNATRAAVGMLWFNESFRPTHGWVAMAHYVQSVLVISVWCAVVLTANEVNRRRSAEMEALRLALVAQTSQFHALRSQLNPHFLFNCLNSLRELIDEDRNRAKQVIDLLSALLRYTLRADRVEMVSLKEELVAVEDYLALEKVRFEERLRTRFDIDPLSLETKLPPMLLQTLAENGVKHGIARLPAGGELAVITQMLEGNLRVEVTNTGELSDATEGSSAVGLDNARERLRLMYGDSASLTLAAAGECKVRAEVVIPLCSNGLRC